MDSNGPDYDFVTIGQSLQFRSWSFTINKHRDTQEIDVRTQKTHIYSKTCTPLMDTTTQSTLHTHAHINQTQYVCS